MESKIIINIDVQSTPMGDMVSLFKKLIVKHVWKV